MLCLSSDYQNLLQTMFDEHLRQKNIDFLSSKAGLWSQLTAKVSHHPANVRQKAVVMAARGTDRNICAKPALGAWELAHD